MPAAEVEREQEDDDREFVTDTIFKRKSTNGYYYLGPRYGSVGTTEYGPFNSLEACAKAEANSETYT